MKKMQKVLYDRYPRSMRYWVVAATGTASVISSLNGLSLVATGTLVMMLVLLVFRDRLTLNLEKRTFRVVQGFYFWRGHIDDFNALVIDSCNQTASGTNQRSLSFTLSFRWAHEERGRWLLKEAYQWEEVVTYAHELARVTGLPIVEGQELIQYRSSSQGASLGPSEPPRLA